MVVVYILIDSLLCYVYRDSGGEKEQNIPYSTRLLLFVFTTRTKIDRKYFLAPFLFYNNLFLFCRTLGGLIYFY